MIVLDDNGNVLVNKKGGAHSVSYGADGSKTTNAILTHNHPSGSSFSSKDMAGMVYYNQKEMRAVGKEYTYSMKRPEKGWGVTPEYAEKVFDQAFKKARNAYKSQFTGNSAQNRKLFIELSHKYNEEAAKKLGWNYSRKKNK